jgi:diaminohydroxyphosphoribosylaminopyrimidine deaminase/5-amino-6-(5-phosphoribosylamino)uracil reductase
MTEIWSAAPDSRRLEVAKLRDTGRADERDRTLMKLALGQARRAIGSTSPNPVVGAVVARGWDVLAAGHHKRAGGPHAERAALEGLEGIDLSGATLYVNLEPCCHYGATPPCTDVIIERKVGRVVASISDPNPLVSGKGFRTLAESGVSVEVGLLAAEATRLNEAYLTRVARGRPFVAVKVAGTWDGRIADSSGRSKWITGLKARRYAHYLRAHFDAVLVGSRTVLLDDPQLDVRLVKGRSPAKIVLDPGLESLRAGSKLLVPGGGRTVFVCGPGGAGARTELALALGVELWEVPSDGAEGLDLGMFLKRAAGEGFSSILVEGGAATVTSFMKARVVDKICLFAAPKLMGSGLSWMGDAALGGLEKGPSIKEIAVRKIGPDVLMSGYLDWTGSR